MEVFSKYLIEYGMTGVFILALLFALRAIYLQFSKQVEDIKESLETEKKEHIELQDEFREYLKDTKKEYLAIIRDNTIAFKEFSKNLTILYNK